MRNSWWAALLGAINIRVSGNNWVQFLNMCHHIRIPLWGVKVRPDYIVLSTSVKGFLAMRKPARRSRCLVRIVARRGLPFVLQRLQKRWSFVFGACLFFATLWLLSNFIWYVDIAQSAFASKEEIARVARVNGLYVGALRDKIDAMEVSKALQRAFPELIFVSVEMSGSRAEIRIVDREIVKPIPRPSGDIVAAKNGLITRIIAFAGRAVVSPNATVIAGQTLISGKFVVNGHAMPPVHAAGIAQARVWYETLGHSALPRHIRVYTGATAQSRWLRTGDVVVLLSGPAKSPYDFYDVVTHKRIMAPFVEHIFMTYREQILQMVVVPREQAVAEAKSQADEHMRSLVPSEAHIVEKRYLEEWSADGQKVMVRVILETLEDIGRFVAHGDP